MMTRKEEILQKSEELAEKAEVCKNIFSKINCFSYSNEWLSWGDMTEKEKSDFLFSLSHQKQ